MLNHLPWPFSFRKHPTYMKIIFYFVTVNVIVLALSFILLYRVSSQTLLKEIGSHSESLLVNGAKNTAQLMEWSIDYSYSTYNDPQLKVYALSDEYNDLDTYQVWTRLMDVKNGNPSIDSVYLINDYTNTVIDSRLGVNDFAGFYDQEVLDKLRSGEIGDKAVLLPRTLTLPLGSSVQKKVITLVISYETNRKSISAFVLNIDTDKMMTLLQNNNKFKETHVSIFNDADELVFTTSALPAPELLEQSRQGRMSASGWKLISPSRQEEQLLVHTSISIKGIQEWSFVETIPKAVILRNINVLGKITMLLFIGLFLASLGMILLISKRVYSPIQELVHNVMVQHRTEKFAERKGASELDYLSDVFVFQSEKIHELTEHWRLSAVLERELLLRRLLNTPPASQTEISADFARLDMTEPEGGFSIAVFRIDHFISFTDKYNEKDRRLLRFALANIVKESLETEGLALETVDMGVDHIAVLLFTPVDRAAFLDRLNESRQLIQQYLSLGTTVALGKALELTTEIHESYLDTYELTQERFGRGHGQVFAREHIPAAPAEMYHLPVELERQLAQAIQKANAEAALALLHTAIAGIRDRSYFECKLSLINLFMQIRRLIQEQTHQPPANSWGLTSVENQIIQLEVLDDVVLWIEDILSQSIREIAEARSISRTALLIEQVDRLIDEHLTDSNLSSKLLADELGLSVNYLRNVYKADTNLAITDRISEKRLKMICEDLINTNSPIEPIIQKYGFSSLNTFYSVFKKMYGVTPAHYRRMHKKQS